MWPRKALALLTLLSSAMAACQPAVGDACEVQTDCGRTMYCERSLPGGYCTVRSCHVTPCPEDSTCVIFDPDTSFCMALCDTNGDCRSSYQCVTDYGPVSFCNDGRADAPPPSPSQEPSDAGQGLDLGSDAP